MSETPLPKNGLEQGVASFRREIKALGALLTVVVVMLSGLSAVSLDTRNDLNDKFNQSLTGLCTFQGDLERRVETSEQFLKDNPDGIPGIPASVLRNSLHNQRLTLRALKSLPCEGVDVKLPRTQITQ